MHIFFCVFVLIAVTCIMTLRQGRLEREAPWHDVFPVTYCNMIWWALFWFAVIQFRLIRRTDSRLLVAAETTWSCLYCAWAVSHEVEVNIHAFLTSVLRGKLHGPADVSSQKKFPASIGWGLPESQSGHGGSKENPALPAHYRSLYHQFL